MSKIHNLSYGYCFWNLGRGPEHELQDSAIWPGLLSHPNPVDDIKIIADYKKVYGPEKKLVATTLQSLAKIKDGWDMHNCKKRWLQLQSIISFSFNFKGMFQVLVTKYQNG